VHRDHNLASERQQAHTRKRVKGLHCPIGQRSHDAKAYKRSRRISGWYTLFIHTQVSRRGCGGRGAWGLRYSCGRDEVWRRGVQTLS
jgi:hypothetical protein